MGARFALIASALAACVTTRSHPIAIQMHDRGLEYLRLARSSVDAPETRRLCDQAEQSCRLALEYDARFAHAYNCLGLLEMTCHRHFDEAAEHFKQALSIDDDFAEAHNNLGAALQQSTPPDYEDATEEFAAAIEIDPAFADARENLALALIHLERWEEARAHLLRLIEIEPLRAASHHQLGLIGQATDRFEDAEHHLKRCLELDEDHPECSYELGNVYLRTERYDDAIFAYVTALRHPSPIELPARQNLRIAYERAAHRDGALVRLIQRCKHEPGNATCHFDLGAIFADRGMFEEAVSEWRSATRLAPDYCPAHYRLAMEANRALDADETARLCRDTIDCVQRTGDQRFEAMANDCRSLVQTLAAR